MCSRTDFCFQRCANRQIVFILHFNAVVGASPSAWRVVSLALSALAKPQVSLGTLGSTIVCINKTFDIYVNSCLFLHNRTETIVLLISSVENAKWPNICCWVRLAFLSCPTYDYAILQTYGTKATWRNATKRSVLHVDTRDSSCILKKRNVRNYVYSVRKYKLWY